MKMRAPELTLLPRSSYALQLRTGNGHIPVSSRDDKHGTAESRTRERDRIGDSVRESSTRF